MPPALCEEILQLDPVRCQFERHTDWVSFGVNDLLAGTEAIIRTLRHHKIPANFRHHTVSLEDAFVHHIGKLAERFE